MPDAAQIKRASECVSWLSHSRPTAAAASDGRTRKNEEGRQEQISTFWKRDVEKCTTAYVLTRLGGSLSGYKTWLASSLPTGKKLYKNTSIENIKAFLSWESRAYISCEQKVLGTSRPNLFAYKAKSYS